MTEIISLAISEMRPGLGDFKIIGARVKDRTLLSMNLSKSEIIDEFGNINWDIGLVTEVTDMKNSFDYNRNVLVKVSGCRPKIYDFKLMKEILKDKSINGTSFFESKTITFSVIEPKLITDISCSNDGNGFGPKHYLSIVLKGNHSTARKLLNKDFKWVHFWNWIFETGKYEQRKEHYKNLLNRQDKKLFLILYRHNFRDNTSYWIAGMHWL